MANLQAISAEQETDIISKWSRQGHLHILEKIVFALTPKAVLTWRKVSPEWCQIIQYFWQSSNRRIQHNQELRKNAVWTLKDPIISTTVFKQFVLKYYVDIQSDNKNIFLCGCADREQKVVVLDANTLDVVRILNTNQGNNKLAFMSLNEDYFSVAFYDEVGEDRISISILVWDRKDDCSLKAEVFNKELPMEGFEYLRRIGHLTVFVFESFLCFPFQREISYSAQWLFCRWIDINRGSVVNIQCLVSQSLLKTEFYPIKNSDKYFSITLNKFFLHNKSMPIIWGKKKKNQSPKLLDYDDQHVAVQWSKQNSEWSTVPTIVEVYNLIDGSVKMIYRVQDYLNEAQLVSGRLALVLSHFKDEFHKLIVFDVNSKKVIYDSLKHSNISMARKFFRLETNQILLSDFSDVENFKITKLLFWV
jgi:hypothetical protein